MVRLREIPRTAVFAWSSSTGKPLLVTGTRAGAVDADFSDETKLELWDLSLDNQEQTLELQPLASISTDSRFYDIAWGPPDEDHPHGVIAGALENGSLDLWDAAKLASGASDAFMSRTTKHTGAIKALEFNPLRPQLLATAGAKGEAFVYNLDDPEKAIRLGTAAARSDDLECIAWNRKVPNILATGGAGGLITVWDVKGSKQPGKESGPKASMTLNNNRKAVSSIAWDPNNSTSLLAATGDDSSPVINLWNLRNSNAPEQVMQGHEQGVLSLSWCQQDPELMLSCGKDNKTLLWNPRTGQKYGELPELTNWTFLTRFNPSNPNLSATASFDGKITIQTLQNTNPSSVQSSAQNNLDGEDFFSNAQTQPQGASFTLTKAPVWFERPIGASFGFGGKIIIFKKNAVAAGQKRSSKLEIASFSADSDLGSATEKFEEDLKSGDVKAICESRLENARTEEEKAEWKILETLVSDNPRQQVIEYLGLSPSDEGVNGSAKDAPEEKVEDARTTGPAAYKKGHNRLSSFFPDGGDGDDFLAGISATKGAKTDNPFHLLSEGNTSVEDSITKALMLGNFTRAAEICVEQNRIADAFIIANSGGKELVDKIQAAYLESKKGTPSYLRLLGSVLAENLWDIVYNADLSDWKETMASLCTFAKPTEFPDLCEALGDRILESGSRNDASFCYLVGSKLEKVVAIWIEELEETEQAGLKEAKEDSTFSVHAKSLQQFIEKVTIFRQVTKFQDSESGLTSDWKLDALYNKYTEYADIVAAHGQLKIAQKYLDLLPTTYPAAETARNRVKLATKPVAAQPAAARQPANSRAASRAQPTIGYQPPMPVPVAAPQQGYPTPAQTPAANPYAPPKPTTGYAPPAPAYGQDYSTGRPSQTGYQPPSYGAPTPYGQPAAPFGAPPRNITPSGTAPPPFKPKDVGQWNDLPSGMVAKAPPPRRSTPSVVTQPFGQQPSPSMPPPSPYNQGPPGGPPPPPKGSAPPRVMSPQGPPQAGGPPRPPSAAANTYAPPPPPQAGAGGLPPPMSHAIPHRTSSPYQPPPSAAPPSNRYAPSPAAQQQFSQPPQQVAPPPGRSPYAAAPPPQAAPGQYAPGPGQVGSAPPPSGRPPVGPPPTAHGGPPPAQPTPPPPRAAAPPKPKHPAGDRSHIPPSAQKLVDILDRDMQRVAAAAPQAFQKEVNDTRKRLNLLFDHLNNEELVKSDTIAQLTELAEAVQARQYDVAQKLQVEIHREKPEQCGNWMVGVKRLLNMSKNIP